MLALNCARIATALRNYILQAAPEPTFSAESERRRSADRRDKPLVGGRQIGGISGAAEVNLDDAVPVASAAAATRKLDADSCRSKLDVLHLK